MAKSTQPNESAGVSFAIFNKSTSIAIADSVSIAGTSSKRRKGLRGIDDLGHGQGLWISPCEAIHTFGMKIAIDAIFIDGNHRVKKVYSAVRPCRIAWCLAADSVIELPESSVTRSQTKAGDHLMIIRNETAQG